MAVFRYCRPCPPAHVRPETEEGEFASWPVSRVLYGSGCPERGSHSSGTAFARCLSQPTRMTGPETGCGGAFASPASSLFGLAPGGVYHAVPVASDAVGSYPTLSPLPRSARCWASDNRGGFLSVAHSLGTPPPDVIRHRLSVEPGLSSPYRLSTLVKRGCPANWHGVLKRQSRRKPTKTYARRTLGRFW